MDKKRILRQNSELHWNINDFSFEYLSSQIMQDVEKAVKIITKIN